MRTDARGFSVRVINNSKKINTLRSARHIRMLSSATSRKQIIAGKHWLILTLPIFVCLQLCTSLLFYWICWLSLQIVMSFVEETKESWLSISLNNEDPFYVSLRHRLSPSYPILRLKAAGPFLPESLANLSSVDTVFALVRKFPDGSHQLVNGHEPLV